jgi:hypothetical protein
MGALWELSGSSLRALWELSESSSQLRVCKIYMQRVAGFCTLPHVYPSKQKWTVEDNKLYNPITKDIVDGVTHELTLQDIEHDPNCIKKSTCIVTNNVDRVIINAEAAKAFGKCNNVLVLQ